MIDTRVESIIYQSQIYYRDLVNTLTSKRKLGKALDCDWEKADTILGYLDALNYRSRLTDEDDRTNVNFILNCLIKICELNTYPVTAPIQFQEAPTVLTGQPGEPGQNGSRGPRGFTGLATDFNVSLITIPIAVDTFAYTDAKGVRWDVVVLKSTGEQRTETILATWKDDGSGDPEFYSDSTSDIVGSTEDLEFNVQIVGSNIELVATPASGQWTVIGSRYFIPNNGNGTGPISDNLANGTIFIGNSSGTAQSRSVSGAIAITNTGVVSVNSGVITNTHINSAAAIEYSKLVALTPSKVAVTDTSGFITSSSLSSSVLAYIDIGSSLTALLAAKLTDPTTTIGDLIYRNGVGAIARLPIGAIGQVLTMSGGLPTWQTPGTGFTDPMTSIGDIIIRNGSNATARLGIGSTNQVLTVSGGVPTWATPVSSTLTGVTSVAGTTYTVLTTDNIIHMNNIGARTVTMFSGASATAGKIYWIKDSAGTASTNAITVNRAGSDTFEGGGTSITITGNRSVQGLYWGDSRWNII